MPLRHDEHVRRWRCCVNTSHHPLTGVASARRALSALSSSSLAHSLFSQLALCGQILICRQPLFGGSITQSHTISARRWRALSVGAVYRAGRARRSHGSFWPANETIVSPCGGRYHPPIRVALTGRLSRRIGPPPRQPPCSFPGRRRAVSAVTSWASVQQPLHASLPSPVSCTGSLNK